jgi:hypothetical protein
MNLFFGFASIVLLAIITYFLGVFRGAPFVPTHQDTVARMIESAQIQPGEKMADLGSGDGRVLIAAARAGAEAHGFEINPLLIWWSRYKIKKAGLTGKAFVHWKNFWLADFSQFQIVMLFGITGIMTGLERKLKAELTPGSRVISNVFKFPNWIGEKNGPVFVYRIEK